ncbi:hypothetical protein ACP70R_009699 [Stipagrostis hirtigluma subsp. patula]
MSSSLPAEDDADSGTGAHVVWSPASPVGGDVVLSGVVLLFVAVAFAFVVHRYFAVRPRGSRDGAGPVSSSGGGQRGTARGDAAAGRGVDPVVLRTLPVTVYRAKDQGAGEAPECAVCLAELADGEAARFLPRCGHGFHAECVDMWLRAHPTCPLCRGDIDWPNPSPSALPPAMPEPANYATNLPTNVLFWGSQDAVTTTARIVDADVGEPSSSAGGAALTIEVREQAAPDVAPRREGGARKPQGLPGLSSLRRLWSRGRHEEAASGSRSCRHGTAADDTERAPSSPLDIWNLT